MIYEKENSLSLYTGVESQLALGEQMLIHSVENYKYERKQKGLRDPVEHYKTRIKEEVSLQEKLQRQQFPTTQESALTKIHDVIGIRVVVTFINDIYDFVQQLEEHSDLQVIKTKDYVKHPKPNGYRSVHLIVELPIEVEGVCETIFGEIQIRTIAMDCWASLEHQLKYKKDDIQNVDLVVEELKRCASEIAATDLTLQTIQEMIEEGDFVETSVSGR